MEFRNFNKNFRRNATTTSEEVVAEICDVNVLYARGKDVFTGHNAVLRARAWLNSKECEDVETEEVRAVNEWAKEATRAADLKNIRKRIALYDPDSKSPQAGKPVPQWMSERHDALKKKPSYTHTRRVAGPQGRRVPRRADASPRDASRRASRVHWEEVLGPRGEVILFELLFENGRFVGRRRTQPGESPQKGSVILDTTGRSTMRGSPPEGFKVWRVRGTRRRPMPRTPQMRAIYESSFLYKVRQLAAGLISLQELHDATRLTGPEKTWVEAGGKAGLGPEPGHWVAAR